MKRVWLLLLLLAGAGFYTGCQKAASGAPDAAPGASVPVNPLLPTNAQPRLATIRLWIGAEEMTAEMALTPMQERTGMMFRTNMLENEGMIFVLDGPQRASFWMMNTVLPLSAAYIDTDGKILEIHDFKPHDTNSVTAATDNIRFVLETTQGWFDRHHIGTNVVIATEKGSLKKTFLGQ